MAKDKTDIIVPPPSEPVTEKLHVLKDGVDYPIHLYATEAAAGDPGETTGTLKIRMGNTDYFARITQNLDSSAAGGATPLRYKKADGTIYQVVQKAEWPIIVPDSSGQTICVSVNGQTYKGANTLWFAEGTAWNAWVEVADSSHIAGSLNITGGTLNGAVNLFVTPAMEIPTGSTSYEATIPAWGGGTRDVGTFTVPEYIHVLNLVGTTPKDSYTKNYTYNVKVTPGKSYPITKYVSRRKSGGRYRDTVNIEFNDLVISYTEEKTATMSVSWSPTINTYATDHDFG